LFDSEYASAAARLHRVAAWGLVRRKICN